MTEVRDLLWQSRGFARRIASQGLLKDTPIVLVDVGCSGGIHPAWDGFGEDLIAYGFDPNRSEIERLQQLESRERVTYVPAFVSGSGGSPDPQTFQMWTRSSAASAQHRWESTTASRTQRQLREANIYRGAAFVDPEQSIVLSEFLQERVQEVDFLKIDVDGDDLGILESFRHGLDSFAVLGVMMEVNFAGSASPTSNTLHNIDRLLKTAGFELFDIEPRRYTSAALPGVFVHGLPGPTTTGRVVQADGIWFRDVINGASTDWDLTRLLKLACLLDITGHSDSIADLLLLERDRFEAVLDVDATLNTLVPSERRQTYRQFIASFDRDDRSFYGTRSQHLRRWLRADESFPARILRRILHRALWRQPR